MRGSTALWLVFAKGVRPAESVVSLPLQVRNLPAGADLEALIPAKVNVTIGGLERDLRRLPEKGLTAQLDLQHRAKNQILLSPEVIQLPREIRLISVSPHAVQLRFHTLHPIHRHSPPPKKNPWFPF